MPRIEKSVEVHVPVQQAYQQWTQFEEFPRFMQHVREVKQLDDTHLHWSMDMGGKIVEWDAEITEQIPNERIAWRNDNGTKGSASVRFAPLDDRRTRVVLTMDYGALQGKNAKEQDLGAGAEEDLQRFARFMLEGGQERGSRQAEIPDERLGAEVGQRASPEATSGQRTDGAQQAGRRDEAPSEGRSDEGSSEARQMQQSDFRMRGEPVRRGAAGIQGHDSRGAQADEARERVTNWALGATRTFTREAERLAGDVASRTLGALPMPTAMSPLPFFNNFLSAVEAPLSMMRRMSEDMGREMEAMMWGAPGTTRRALAADAAPQWSPSIDAIDQKGEYVICADLPGVHREDVDVEVRNGQLVISGERHVERKGAAQDNGHGVGRMERLCGPFSRTIALPEGARAEEAQASMTDGVLEIRVPLRHHDSRRRIEIREGNGNSESHRDDDEDVGRPGREGGKRMGSSSGAQHGQSRA